MKLTNSTLSRMVKSVVRGEKQYGEHQMLHPTREWFSGVAFFLLVCLGGAWWAATVYLKYDDSSVYQDIGSSGEELVYREAKVEEALELLTERKAAYAAVESRLRGAAPVPSPDPEISTSTDSVDDAVLSDNSEEDVETPISDEVEATDGEDGAVSDAPVEPAL